MTVVEPNNSGAISPNCDRISDFSRYLEKLSPERLRHTRKSLSD
ncbi:MULTISPECIES: hypothetical protein [unclassified Nostoc]|nr:hypothetical protein [Nostoc sp. C052]